MATGPGKMAPDELKQDLYDIVDRFIFIFSLEYKFIHQEEEYEKEME